MTQIISCFFIAIALSMDTFSLSLSIGTYSVSKKNCLQLSTIVGIMHFIMPFLGNIIGSGLITFFSLNANKLLGGILLFLAINLLTNILKNEQITNDFSFLGMLIFAFGVSLDAFSTGLGLTAITNNKILAMTIFSLTSFTFTLMGLKIGSLASKYLGKKAQIMGVILLIILGLYHLFL